MDWCPTPWGRSWTNHSLVASPSKTSSGQRCWILHKSHCEKETVGKSELPVSSEGWERAKFKLQDHKNAE